MAAEQMYFTPEKQTKQHIVNAKLAAMAYAKLHDMKVFRRSTTATIPGRGISVLVSFVVR